MTAPARRTMPALPAEPHRVHIIGVCGTGMGSLAGMLKERGFEVRGSDTGAYPPMSTWLESRGIPILTGWDAANLDWGPELVVVGNVCRRDNPEAVEAAARGIVCVSFPEALRALFLTGRRPLVVTGTHGKTTTSSLLAWLLEVAGCAPSFMVGGIAANFGGNFKLADGACFVVEGDEYDTAFFDKVPKFWHYAPFRATINNIEFDHGDIYPDLASIVAVFEAFAAMVPTEGTLWVNGDDPRAVEVATRAQCRVRTFGLDAGNALRPTSIRYDEAETVVELALDGASLGSFRSPLPGEHNVRNLMGALALALDEGADLEAMRAGLPAFASVRKRQELKGQAGGVRVYDDFAHHPTAVRETLRAIRHRYPNAPLWAIFEAKSNTSRMAIFQHDYLAAFEAADHVVLSAPWKKDAHLSEGERIDLGQLAAELSARGQDAVHIPTVEAIVEHVASRARAGDVVVGMSGSNFAGFHDKLLARLAGGDGGG